MNHKSNNSKTRSNQIIQKQTHLIIFKQKFLNIQNNFSDHHHIYEDRSKQGMKVVVLLKNLPNESSIYSTEVI